MTQGLTPKFDDSTGKYGYVRNGGDDLAIPPRFEEAGHFQNGRAVVRLNGRYGFIDTRGTLLVEPLFEALGDFWPCRTRAKLDGKWGYINAHGAWAISPKFDFAWIFADISNIESAAFVETEGMYGQIDIYGELREGLRPLPEVVPYHMADPRAWDFISSSCV